MIENTNLKDSGKSPEVGRREGSMFVPKAVVLLPGYLVRKSHGLLRLTVSCEGGCLTWSRNLSIWRSRSVRTLNLDEVSDTEEGQSEFTHSFSADDGHRSSIVEQYPYHPAICYHNHSHLTVPLPHAAGIYCSCGLPRPTEALSFNGMRHS